MAQGKDFIIKEYSGSDVECESRKIPEVDFSTFIISLYSSALVQLGEIPDPVTGTRAKDLCIAKQTIDMIAMLEKKTSGNLDIEEEKLLKSLLHELRMTYVKVKC
ncbi:MAG: DUF1844 domain-containing protein [Desulfamplus sp.]|nr:DUF1844 domain-containing protein [Desulfamplus sp.]MBF0413463.1 DUF1844 domain-containing protein [Desulfamplus sp.]